MLPNRECSGASAASVRRLASGPLRLEHGQAKDDFLNYFRGSKSE